MLLVVLVSLGEFLGFVLICVLPCDACGLAVICFLLWGWYNIAAGGFAIDLVLWVYMFRVGWFACGCGHVWIWLVSWI